MIDELSSVGARSAIDAAIVNGETNANWQDLYDANTALRDVYSDMYDGANRITTALSGSSSYLAYDYWITRSDSTHFGAGSRHRTFYGDKFWMLVVENNRASTLTISGNLGADGYGSMNAYSFIRGGHSVFIKQVYSAYDPSVNHIIITPYNGGQTHTFSTNTNDDQHEVTGLTAGKNIVYALVAGRGGYFYSQAQFESMVDAILASGRIPPFDILMLQDTI